MSVATWITRKHIDRKPTHRSHPILRLTVQCHGRMIGYPQETEPVSLVYRVRLLFILATSIPDAEE